MVTPPLWDFPPARHKTFHFEFVAFHDDEDEDGDDDGDDDSSFCGVWSKLRADLLPQQRLLTRRLPATRRSFHSP